MNDKHTSVLLQETITNLKVKDNGIYVDMTLGYGGHSSQILTQLTKGYLYCFDQDDQAIEYSQSRLEKIGSNFTIIKSNFINLKEKLKEVNTTSVDGIIFDLGVSSPQLDDGDRGFSFHKEARLDMRMDQNNPLSAYEVVNNYSLEKLVHILYVYGEEKFAPSIAKNIIKCREEKPIETTTELVNVISAAVPMKERLKRHPARKSFQAIRIEVNDELNVFHKALVDALEILNVHGRICVITFQPLEDRICKQIFKQVTEIDPLVKGMPNIPDEQLPDYKLITTKPIIPNAEELNNNNRSRTAKLRVIERIK